MQFKLDLRDDGMMASCLTGFPLATAEGTMMGEDGHMMRMRTRNEEVVVVAVATVQAELQTQWTKNWTSSHALVATSTTASSPPVAKSKSREEVE